MSKVDPYTYLLEALLYLIIMLFFGFSLNEGFFWLGLIGLAETIVISYIEVYTDKKEEKERKDE